MALLLSTTNAFQIIVRVAATQRNSGFENAVVDRLLSWQSSSMWPILTINSLTPDEIRQDVKEMQEFRKKLVASPAKAKKFFKTVRLACGEGVPVKKAKR